MIDTHKKPHFSRIVGPRGVRWWAGEFRGLVYFGKTPEDVMANICRYLKYGNILP